MFSHLLMASFSRSGDVNRTTEPQNHGLVLSVSVAAVTSDKCFFFFL